MICSMVRLHLDHRANYLEKFLNCENADDRSCVRGALNLLSFSIISICSKLFLIKKRANKIAKLFKIHLFNY